MRKELRVVLPLVLFALLVGTILAANDTATHEITVTIPEYVSIEILNGDIDVNFADFGQTVTTGPVGVKYRCNKSGSWALTVSATDFIAEAATHSFLFLIKWGLSSGVSTIQCQPMMVPQVATWILRIQQPSLLWIIVRKIFAGNCDHYIFHVAL